MGHVRLGRLPKTKKWNVLFNELKDSESSLKDIVSITSVRAKSALAESRLNETLPECFGLFANIAQASRGTHFIDELNYLSGLNLDANMQGIDLLEALGALAKPSSKIDVLDRMAFESYREVLLETIRSQSDSLFGCNIETVQKAFKKHSTPKEISQLGHRFFSTYIFKSFSYVLEKELANVISENGRFRQPEDIKDFNNNLRKYCNEIGKYVEQYSGDWYKKHIFDKDFADPTKLKQFTNYAMSKMLLEMHIEEKDL